MRRTCGIRKEQMHIKKRTNIHRDPHSVFEKILISKLNASASVIRRFERKRENTTVEVRNALFCFPSQPPKGTSCVVGIGRVDITRLRANRIFDTVPLKRAFLFVYLTVIVQERWLDEISKRKYDQPIVELSLEKNHEYVRTHTN